MTFEGAREMRIGISIVEKGATLPAGVHRYAANVVRALLARPNVSSVVVFTHSNKAVLQYLEPDEAERIELVFFRPSVDNAVSAMLWHLLVLPVLARRHAIDLLHVTNGRVVGPIPGVPKIVTLHDLAELDVDKKFDSARTAYRKLIQHPFMRRQQAVLTVSESARRDIERHFGQMAPTVFVAPNYAHVAKPLNSQLPEGRYLLYVGRIDHPSKNLLTLIRAFDIAARQDESLQLKLVGSDSWDADLVHKAAADAEHSERIEFLGWVPDDRLHGLMAGALALCLPSLHEGFGLPVAESLAMGTPVIGADAGSIPEVLGTREGLVAPFDTLAWASTILEVTGSETARSEFLSKQIAAQSHIGPEAMERTAQALEVAYTHILDLSAHRRV